MKIFKLVFGFSAVLFSVTPAFALDADKSCPGVDDIRSNATMLDTVFHHETDKVPDFFMNDIDYDSDFVYSNKSYKYSKIRFHFAWEAGDVQGDDQKIQTAQQLAASVTQRDMALVYEGRGKDKYQLVICAYSDENKPGDEIVAFYSKGKIPFDMNKTFLHHR